MVRVVGTDAGTGSWSMVLMEDGSIVKEADIPARVVAQNPEAFVKRLIELAKGADLVVAPFGYGMPVKSVSDLTDKDILELTLKKPGEPPVMGLAEVLKLIKKADINAVVIPGVKHLPTVPEHRKVNKIDMGTPDKVCAAALAISEQAKRLGLPYDEISLVLVEMGRGFTSVLSVKGGQIVDGVGGSSGPMGMRACGALDGEVAYLLGRIKKDDIRRGGSLHIAGAETVEELGEMFKNGIHKAEVAVRAYVEGIVRYVAGCLAAVAFSPRELVLSGYVASIAPIVDAIREALLAFAPVTRLRGQAKIASQASEGAAIIADGLAGGRYKSLVDRMRIKEAMGSVYDFLAVTRS